jgi:hypothetical protein
MKTKNFRFLFLVLSSVSSILFMLSSSVLKETDNFKVIKVDGKISFVKTGKDLVTGDLFKSDEKLNFSTQDSRAAVISKKNGRFVLTAEQKGGGATNLVPALTNFDTRGGALINALGLKDHFSNRYLLLNELSIKISKDVYPMSSSSFFYIQYEYNGEKVPKKLSKFKGEVLTLSAQDIFTIDGKQLSIPLETSVTLYYKDEQSKKTLLINDFVLVAPNEKVLIDEVKIIIDELGNKSKDQKKSEIIAYLFEFYGKPQQENVTNWLKNNVNL